MEGVLPQIKDNNQRASRMLDRICRLGGDTDTIGAMAGAIWGAFNGCSALDQNRIRTIENSVYIIQTAERLHAMVYEYANKAGEMERSAD